MLKLYNCFQSEDKEYKIMELEKKIKESDDKVKKTERLMITKKEKITKLTKEVTYTTTIKQMFFQTLRCKAFWILVEYNLCSCLSLLFFLSSF